MTLDSTTWKATLGAQKEAEQKQEEERRCEQDRPGQEPTRQRQPQ